MHSRGEEDNFVLPDDIINKVIDGVKAKLAAGDIADKVDDLKDALGGLFSKFKK